MEHELSLGGTWIGYFILNSCKRYIIISTKCRVPTLLSQPAHFMTDPPRVFIIIPIWIISWMISIYDMTRSHSHMSLTSLHYIRTLVIITINISYDLTILRIWMTLLLCCQQVELRVHSEIYTSSHDDLCAWRTSSFLTLILIWRIYIRTLYNRTVAYRIP